MEGGEGPGQQGSVLRKLADQRVSPGLAVLAPGQLHPIMINFGLHGRDQVRSPGGLLQ
jgi:hypothetical protein